MSVPTINKVRKIKPYAVLRSRGNEKGHGKIDLKETQGSSGEARFT